MGGRAKAGGRLSGGDVWDGGEVGESVKRKHKRERKCFKCILSSVPLSVPFLVKKRPTPHATVQNVVDQPCWSVAGSTWHQSNLYFDTRLVNVPGSLNHVPFSSRFAGDDAGLMKTLSYQGIIQGCGAR